MQEKFDIKFKGYDRAQVDEYILNLTKNYERSLAAQRDRIESMKAEIAAKEKLLQEYISRKESITNSITQAVRGQSSASKGKRVCGSRQKADGTGAFNRPRSGRLSRGSRRDIRNGKGQTCRHKKGVKTAP